MALSKEEKKIIIKKNAKKEGDTGSLGVQIAILSREIEELNKHLKKHPLDLHSKRGFLNKNKKRNTLKNK
ncbi:30S ribosomal protein S15 [Candidatus Phytoplasma pini]|uniref:30S ribosomal protein S15 n=1 Tax=Candidatus Phytoplasma pini TaxID=267362 RepID=A0A559KJN9_9MOLU|nr:30S ribosomal protein S15 [Candidatus Phytoplasma pini]TVY12308.1 ribosomal protein S15P/S13E [Candidatus Phytoplasma pini]